MDAVVKLYELLWHAINDYIKVLTTPSAVCSGTASCCFASNPFLMQVLAVHEDRAMPGHLRCSLSVWRIINTPLQFVSANLVDIISMSVTYHDLKSLSFRS